MLQALLKLGGWLYSRGEVKIYKFFFKKMTKSNFYFCLKLIIIIIKKEIWSQRFFFLLQTHTARNFVFKKRNILEYVVPISLKKKKNTTWLNLEWFTFFLSCTTFTAYTDSFLSIIQYT